MYFTGASVEYPEQYKTFLRRVKLFEPSVNKTFSQQALLVLTQRRKQHMVAGYTFGNGMNSEASLWDRVTCCHS